jgi:hypothetical protein
VQGPKAHRAGRLDLLILGATEISVRPHDIVIYGQLPKRNYSAAAAIVVGDYPHCGRSTRSDLRHQADSDGYIVSIKRDEPGHKAARAR